MDKQYTHIVPLTQLCTAVKMFCYDTLALKHKARIAS